MLIVCQAPKPTTSIYILDGLREKSRTCETVLYDGKDWCLVPVINGFVPQIKHRGQDVVYDYTGRIRLSNVQHKIDLSMLPHPVAAKQVVKQKPKPKPKQKPKPKIKSTFDPKLKRATDIDEPEVLIRPTYTHDGSER